MEMILSELREGGVDMDMRTLAYHVDSLRERHEALYDQMAARVNPAEMAVVFGIMNVTNFGRAMAYLVLVHTMNIPEETKRAAVRLVVGPLTNCDMSLYRIVKEGWFRRWFRRVFGR